MKKIDRNYIYDVYYNKYKLMALNLFKWENLPTGLESRHIENALFNYGGAIFYKKNGGYVCFGASQCGMLNVYCEPIEVIANYYGGTEQIKLKNDNVLIYNNDLLKRTDYFVRYFAERMTNIELSIQANINQQKFPYFAKGNQKNLFSLKQLFNNLENDEPILFADKTLDDESLKVFNLNIPYVVNKLREEKFELEREILTFFGLNNNFEKKERLLTDEINSNNEYINNNLQIMYKCRQLAAEEINKKFGFNVVVKKINSDKEVDFE